MITVNPCLPSMPNSYLFAEVARRRKNAEAMHRERRLISLGIGDVSKPLPQAAVRALHAASDEMGAEATLKGYGPAEGYAFLRSAVCAHDYATRGVTIYPEEVFITTGAKETVAQFQWLFDRSCIAAVSDPVYPVYAETNAMAGRAGQWNGQEWERLVYLPCLPENDFMPMPPDQQADIICLCSPNNPTGTVMTRSALEAWVRYARERHALIFFDAAYEAFITDEAIPHSIFEIEGAREVAVEFRSFSKTAGFTGLRCGYLVVPQEVSVPTPDGSPVNLNALWKRHQDTCFNGCSYPVQRAAEATYSLEGQKQCRIVIESYLANAAAIRKGAGAAGLRAYGGINAPYVWVETPGRMPSWDFFDLLLTKGGLVCTPGAGFGPHGEGYVRMTAFATAEDTAEAMDRLLALSGSFPA